MPTAKVVDVIDRATIILQDATSVRFPLVELLKFFNDAQKEVVLHRPDASMVNATFACATGSKQSLPSAALRLVGIPVADRSLRLIVRYWMKRCQTGMRLLQVARAYSISFTILLTRRIFTSFPRVPAALTA